MTTQQSGVTAQWNVLPSAPNDSHLHELIRVLGIALVGQVSDEELLACGGHTNTQDAYYVLKAMKKRKDPRHKILVKELLKDRNEACHGNLLSKDTVNLYWAFVNTVRLCDMLGAPTANFINTFNLGKLIWLSALQPHDLTKLTDAGVDLGRQFKFTLYTDETQSKKDKSDQEKGKEDKSSDKGQVVLCKFGQSCNNSSCIYVHRSLTKDEKAKEPCKFGSLCRFKDCLYGHPSNTVPTNAVPFTSKLIQCKFGSNCTASDCSFGHPEKSENKIKTSTTTTNTSSFSNSTNQFVKKEKPPKANRPAECKFGFNCLKTNCAYYHPSLLSLTKSTPSASSIECRFGANCTKSDCSYSHPTMAKPNKTSNSNPIECKFGNSCNSKNCSYSHPISINSNSNNSSSSSFGSTSTSSKPCNFGSSCAKPNCSFSHPTPISKSNQMPADCKFGSHCKKESCSFSHPSYTSGNGSKNLVSCKFGLKCTNKDCTYGH